VTRDLLGWTGDTGAPIRITMGTLALFGVPPEKHWPYEISRFDEEPSAFCYSYAQNYQALKYFRFDVPLMPRSGMLIHLKRFLASRIPMMFGFTVYGSISQAVAAGRIPYPHTKDSVLGAHAVMAVGYDDKMKIANSVSKEETTGALLIRNSWGDTWGEAGYGWLPYDYVLYRVAPDFWSILEMGWIETGQFGL
jgi:C1A family cysteine protease